MAETTIRIDAHHWIDGFDWATREHQRLWMQYRRDERGTERPVTLEQVDAARAAVRVARHALLDFIGDLADRIERERDAPERGGALRSVTLPPVGAASVAEVAALRGEVAALSARVTAQDTRLGAVEALTRVPTVETTTACKHLLGYYTDNGGKHCADCGARL